MNAKAFLSFFAAIMAVASLAVADTLYVDVNSTNPVPPYTNWSTAANVIQDAVDAASGGDTVVVTDGVYDTGGKAVYGTMTNRVAVDKPVTLVSVNGPEVTIIQGRVPLGNHAVRCAYLTNDASLVGFTLTNGATRIYGHGIYEASGGGLFCESDMATASNCVLVGNESYGAGGGAYQGTLHQCVIELNASGSGGGGVLGGSLHNCVVKGNTSNGDGGGLHSCHLNNCTVVDNTAVGFGSYGGGTYASSVSNCIVYYNVGSAANHMRCTMKNCCTSPMPNWGPGNTQNITNAPLFVDTNNWSDLRLQSNSPCINSGNNTYVTATDDLDGNSRIAGGTVDIGAYEFQSPQSFVSYAYLQQYGLPTDGSVDGQDGDGDNASTWQEWKMWTIPTNGLSVLKMLNPATGTNGTDVRWQSVSNQMYTLERAPSDDVDFTVLESGIAGQAGTTTFTDTTATNGDAFLYRVSVPE